MNTVEAIPAQTLKSIALVGRVVTFCDQQWQVYSVEGYDYYAFPSATGSDTVTCDFAMTPSEWKREPVAVILPVGAKIGEGLSKEVPVKYLKLGVCLTKQTDTAWCRG